MTNEPDLTLRPRTRRVFSEDDMKRMAALYYDPTVPMHRVGAAFGVPTSTFLRWIAEMEWPRRSARGSAALTSTLPGERAGQSAGKPSAQKLRMPGRVGKILGQEAPESLVAFTQACMVARIELDAISAYPAQTLHERERVARLMSSMSATLMRLQRGYEKELTRFVTPIAKRQLGLE